eukprot:g1551.t1
MLRLAYLGILYWWYGGSLSSVSEEVTAESSGERTPSATASAAGNASPAPVFGSQLPHPSPSASGAELEHVESGIRANPDEAQGAGSGGTVDHELEKLLKRVSIVDKLTSLAVLTSFVSDLDLCADWYFFRKGLEGESTVISDVALVFTVLGTVMYVLITVEFHFVSKARTVCRGGQRLSPLQHIPLGWQLLLNVLVEDMPQLIISCVISPTSVAGVLNITTAGFALLAKMAEGFSTRHDLPMSAQLRMVEVDPRVVRHMVVQQREAEEQAANAAMLAVFVNEFRQVRDSHPWSTKRREEIALRVMQLDPGFLNGKLDFIRETLGGFRLDLARTELNGPVPQALGTLTDLQELLLFNTGLNGSIPSTLGSLRRLTMLRLQNNQLEGAIPPEIGNLCALAELDLSHNKLNGAIPPELGNLSALTELDLSHNRLNGAIPRQLGAPTELRVLSLCSNQLEGAIPIELGNLSKLEGLQLWSNKFSGAIPPEFGRLTALLRHLWLHLDQLTGAIPMELGNLNKLEKLYLGGNNLAGAIPPELGALTALKHINLYDSQLIGTIPPELGELTALKTLYLSKNQLTGIIPTELGRLTALHQLDLSKNQLSGTIPPELGGLTALRELFLSNNLLTGVFPGELRRLRALRVADFVGNSFEGTKAEVKGIFPSRCGNWARVQLVTGVLPNPMGRAPCEGRHRNHLEKREGMKVGGMFKSPLTIVLVLSMIMMVFLPKMMENLDLEQLEEMKPQQKTVQDSTANLSFSDMLSMLWRANNPNSPSSSNNGHRHSRGRGRGAGKQQGSQGSGGSGQKKHRS